MPRSRKQVARFDPSPEAVASWNDTSSKIRVQVDLQARVRHGLASAEAAAALAAAAAASAAKEEAAKAALDCSETSVAPLSRPSVPAPGRKRQRAAAGSEGVATSPYDVPTWPPISELHAGRMGISPPPSVNGVGTGDGGGGGHARVGSSATDSSISCSTSGSDSDSSYSCASDMSVQNLPWREDEVAATAADSGGGSVESVVAGTSVSVTASASGTDTDSEYCSDLVPPPSLSVSATSDGCSSCSTTPLAAAMEDVGGSGDCSGPAGEGAEEDVLRKSRKRDEEADEDELQRVEKRRNLVTVRLARSQMPPRWAAPPPPFQTCLDDVRPEDKLVGDQGGGAFGGDDAAAAVAASMLGLCEGDGVDARSWLTSGFIDVIMAKFARTYPNVHFMPIDFAALCLRGWGSESPSSASTATGSDDGHGGLSAAAAAALADESMVFKDILGRPIVYSEQRPVIFLTHVNNVHWNLLRVEHDPVPELQLFEPMGKPPRRQGGSRTQAGAAASSASRGTGFRCIPKEVYRWLDAVWPLRTGSTSNIIPGGKRKATSPTPSHEGWASHAYSAITRQQQTTGFDCGVAALLYAEKCGQGQMREDVDAWTTQADMTEYRRALQRYVEKVVPTYESSFSSSGLDVVDASTPPPPLASPPRPASPPPPPPLPLLAPIQPAVVSLPQPMSVLGGVSSSTQAE